MSDFNKSVETLNGLRKDYLTSKKRGDIASQQKIEISLKKFLSKEFNSKRIEYSHDLFSSKEFDVFCKNHLAFPYINGMGSRLHQYGIIDRIETEKHNVCYCFTKVPVDMEQVYKAASEIWKVRIEYTTKKRKKASAKADVVKAITTLKEAGYKVLAPYTDSKEEECLRFLQHQGYDVADVKLETRYQEI